MLYLRTCFDAPGTDALRNEIRSVHRAYLKPFVEGEKPVHLLQAGPLCVSDTDDTNLGSFFIVEAPSLSDVQEFHDGDPFTKAGVYGRVELVRWDRHIGN